MANSTLLSAVADCGNSTVANVTTLSSIKRDNTKCDAFLFVAYTIVLSTICIVGTFFNLTAFVVFCKAKINSSTAYLFQALCIIDTAYLVLMGCSLCARPLFFVTNYIYRLKESPTFFWYTFGLAMITRTATIWTTLLVAFNRYIAVCKPHLAPRLCTVLLAKKQVAVVLIAASVYSLPLFWDIRVLTINLITDDHNSSDLCNSSHVSEYYKVKEVLKHDTAYQILYYTLGYNILIGLGPFLVLTLITVQLIRALKEIKKKRAEISSLKERQNCNITRVLIAVVLVFIVCQTPAHVHRLCDAFLPYAFHYDCDHFQLYFYVIAKISTITNSAVNFFIYYLLYHRFHEVLTGIFCREESRRRRYG